MNGRLRRYVAFLPHGVLAILAVTLFGTFLLERQIGGHLDGMRAHLVVLRLHIVTITNIRRDMRKTYVSTLERWHAPPGDWSRLGAGIQRQVSDVMRAVDAFALEHPSLQEEEPQQKALLRVCTRWAQNVRAVVEGRAGASVDGLRTDVAGIDAVAEAILVLHSTAAARADEESAAARAKQGRVRWLMVGSFMCLIGGGVIWRVRVAAAERLASAERAVRAQQDLNVVLEQRVAERTKELAASLDRLRRSQADLVQAGRMAGIGRLAAGVAHEINTPIQFVSDSVAFIGEAVEELTGLVSKHRAAYRAAAGEGDPPDGARVEEEADLAFLLENLPPAVARSLDGLSRVGAIVKSLKDFVRPDETGVSSINLNHAIENTLTVARNDYANVADVVTDFGSVPPVPGYAGEVNQALLSILVNAAQAITAVVGDTGRRGVITIRTRQDGEWAVVSIADTGTGIPPEAREHVFDPFFTTKDVGVGTGQGLTIARSVVVDKHHGALTFDTGLGQGTTFTIRLPLTGRPAA